MQINLKGHIVILDEAHNIEDTCRQAASVNLKDDDLTNAANECELLSRKRPDYYKTYLTIYTYLNDLVKFLQNVTLKNNVSVLLSCNQFSCIDFTFILIHVRLI